MQGIQTKKWTRQGQYAMRCEPWTISKSFVDGCTLYVVWKDGVPGPLAFKNDFDEAVEWIEEVGK